MTTDPEPPLNAYECEICRSGTDTTKVRNYRHINLLPSRLTEPQRRWYVVALSDEPESRNTRQLALITGLDEMTIRRERAEFEVELSTVPIERHPRAGGGLGPKIDPTVESKLLEVIAPRTAGDPVSSQKWLNCRSSDIQERLGGTVPL